MSEEALSAHIDARIADGDAAPLPEDSETRALSGTVKLVQATLSGSAPSAAAESASRERLLTQMRESTLEPRELHDAPGTRLQSSWLGGLISRLRNLFK